MSPEPAGPSAPSDREAFRAQLVAAIPGWYSPWAHLLFPSLVALLVIAGMISLLRDLRPLQLLTIPVVYLVSNAVEWRLHRDVLHRRFPFFEVIYDRHTPQHHRMFVDGDMAMRERREFRLVLIPFYGVLGIIAMDAPAALLLGWLGLRNVAALFIATSAFYVVSYEWLHLAYHLPETHPVGRLAIIARLRRHHATHHDPRLMQRWNFNVTVPLWDLVRGTIYRGPALPPLDGAAGSGPAGR